MRLRSIAIAILFMVSSFVGLIDAATESRTFTDDLGRDVNIPSAPDRIVSLAPSSTEVLFALGMQDRVVGVTEYCRYPPEIEGLKEKGAVAVVGGYKDPDPEKIISLQPDLVLASKIQGASAIPQLEKAGIPVFAVASNNLSGVFKTIKRIGDITGAEAEASELIGRLQSRIRAVSARVDGLPKKRVFYLLWHDPLQTAGQDTVQDEIIEMAGGANIFHHLLGYPQVDPESIAQQNPEVIITGTSMGESRDAPFIWAQTEDSLADTDARATDRIYQVEGDLMTRPGPRIVDALEMLAKIFHPDGDIR